MYAGFSKGGGGGGGLDPRYEKHGSKCHFNTFINHLFCGGRGLSLWFASRVLESFGCRGPEAQRTLSRLAGRLAIKCPCLLITYWGSLSPSQIELDPDQSQLQGHSILSVRLNFGV